MLAPTRELVMQIGAALSELGRYTGLRTVVLYGGLGPKTQIEQLQAGCDVVVSTPGRFLDLYLRGEISTKELRMMVLDEADKMMDMGFMPQIRRILEVIPRKRQNLLFSATFPQKVERLSHEFLDFPTRIEVTPQATAAVTVAQWQYEVPNLATKLSLLAQLLARPEAEKVLVFVRSREVANRIHQFIARKAVPEEQVRVIHANKGQNTRINAIDGFRQEQIRVLVATDVAARGLDVPQVSHVINFDVPLIYEDYVHRIGRTGRALHTGEAHTFVTPAEQYHVGRIEQIIGQAIPAAELPAGMAISETPFEERQAQLRELDAQRRRQDPAFQGAFHEKKKRPAAATSRKKKPAPGRRPARKR